MIRYVLSTRLSHLLSLAAAACCALLLCNGSVARADDAGQPISSEARIDYDALSRNLAAGGTTPEKIIAIYGTKCWISDDARYFVWNLDNFGIPDNHSGFVVELRYDEQGKLLRVELACSERQTGFHLGLQANQ